MSAVVAVRRSKQGPRGSKAPTLNVIQLVYSLGKTVSSFRPTSVDGEKIDIQ